MNKNKGNVLWITLILVSIAAGVTITSMRGTVLQEKMVKNETKIRENVKEREKRYWKEIMEPIVRLYMTEMIIKVVSENTRKPRARI